MFKKNIKKQANKVDKIVTWLIIWWAIAWIVWASKTKSWKKFISKTKDTTKNIVDSWTSSFWRFLVKIISLFKRKK